MTKGNSVRGTKIRKDTRTQEQRLKSRKINKEISWSNYIVQVEEKWEVDIGMVATRW